MTEVHCAILENSQFLLTGTSGGTGTYQGTIICLRGTMFLCCIILPCSYCEPFLANILPEISEPGIASASVKEAYTTLFQGS
jgi:hypothetical protein